MKKQILTTIMLFAILASFLSFGVVYAQPIARISVIVGFKDKPDQNLVVTHGGIVKYNYKIINAIAASLPTQAIEALKRNPNVLYVEPVQEVQAVETELDRSWGVERIGAGIVHEINKGAGIQVAVLDTGIDYNHPDLDDNFETDVKGYDFVNGDNNPLDDNGHGTHCAGIIAAEDNEPDVGVVGVAPEATLYAVKVLDSRGSGYTDDIIAGIDWAMLGPDNIDGTDDDAEVISMSLGALYNPPTIDPFEEACDAAYSSGTLVVAAAGNDGITTENSYPAAYSSVIAVGATDEYDDIAAFSNKGSFLELVAPGVNVYSTMPTYAVTLTSTGPPPRRFSNNYDFMTGTSMACPHVAGVAALVFASGVSSVSEVRAALDSTAEKLGYSPNVEGNGLVDAEAAVAGTSIGEAPIVSWVNPTEASTVQGSVSIQIAASDDKDEIGTLNVEWEVNGITQTADYSELLGLYTGTWITTGVSDGPYTLTVTATDSGNEVETATITVTVSNEVVETVMYVWDISWVEAGPHLKSIVTIRYDSDNDGVAEVTDAVVTNAEIVYELVIGGETNVYSGVTDSNGQFVVMWKRAPAGTCRGTVTSLTHSTYEWDSILDHDNPDTYP